MLTTSVRGGKVFAAEPKIRELNPIQEGGCGQKAPPPPPY